MTLEEKAKKYVFSNPPSVVIYNHSYFLPSDLKQAYLAGAKELEKENKTLKGCLLAEQEHTLILEKENKLLGERCNQLLKDKGDLTDKVADIKANCDFAIEGKDVKIMELEQENNKLLDVINNQDVKIADLEKENTELKEKLNIRSCQNCKHNNKSCPNDGSCKHYSKWEDCENPQLTKAKEIIREIMKYEIPTLDYEKAEQFLKEIEK